MAKFTKEDNLDAMKKAFELFAYCLSHGPCNGCMFFDKHVDGDTCTISCPNSWPLFDPNYKNGSNNRQLVLSIINRKDGKNNG